MQSLLVNLSPILLNYIPIRSISSPQHRQTILFFWLAFYSSLVAFLHNCLLSTNPSSEPPTISLAMKISLCLQLDHLFLSEACYTHLFLHLYMFYTVLYKASKKISKQKTHLFFNYARYISKSICSICLTFINLFKRSVSDTEHLCIFCLFLASKIFKDRQ